MLSSSIVDNNRHRLADGAEANARDWGAGFIAVTDSVDVLVICIVIISSLNNRLLLILVTIAVVVAVRVAVRVLAVVAVGVGVVVVVVVVGVVGVRCGLCDHKLIHAVRGSRALRQSRHQAGLQHMLPLLLLITVVSPL